MIQIIENLSNKLPSYTSLYLTLPFYNQDLFRFLSQIEDSYYNPTTNEFEILPNKLYLIVDKLIQYDQVELQKFSENIIKKYQCNENSFKIKPYPYQLDGINYGLNKNQWLLLDDQGLGKAVALDTKVFTPNGYKLMRDIHVGDYVFNRKGESVKVLAEYNHSLVDMYEITFSDGVKIKCCKDHLWKIYDQHGSKVVSTQWFLQKDQFGKIRAENLKCCGAYKYHIDLCEPVRFEHQDIPMDAYLLGCLIGDGNLGEHSVSITSADDFIINEFNKRLPKELTIHKIKDDKYSYRISKTCSKRNVYVDVLRELGLSNTKSQNKFVPDVYKYNDIETRKQILQGLMDTDGYAMKNGNCALFTSTSKQLVEDVVFLVQSLGGIAKISSKECGYKKNGIRKITGIAYTATIRHKSPQELFSLPRKREILSDRHFLPRRNIVNIEKIPNSSAKCITVDDSESLYLIENFVVTHNTLQMIYLAQELKERENIKHCLIICGINSLKYNWADEIKKFSDLSYKVLGEYITKTGKTKIASIQKRLEELKENIDEFFVIINKEVMQNKDFIKTYQKSKNKFDMIILDEAHKLVSPTSLSAKALLKLQATYKIALSGTIIMNVPENTYVSLKWTNNIKSTFTQFKHTYNIYGGYGGVSVIGYKNLEILQELISKCSLRRLKTDELPGLPEKTFIEEYVDLLPEQQRLYDNVEVGILEELNKLDHIPTIVEELTINMRLRQISAYPGILSEEIQQSAKLERLEELVESIVAQGDKVVVFNTFKESAKREFELLNKYNPALCTGDQSEIEINNNKNIFNSDDNCKVMICTWQKMGTGHTLTSANYCIFVDTPWTWADFNQAADRIHRIGQNKHVFIITLISKNTYDERVKEILNNKKNLSDYVIDKKN